MLSGPAPAIRAPSGEKATLVTPISCPRRQAASAPVRASQTRTVLTSSDAIAILGAVGWRENLLVATSPTSPRRKQAISVPLSCRPEANRLCPSNALAIPARRVEKATLVIPFSCPRQECNPFAVCVHPKGEPSCHPPRFAICLPSGENATHMTGPSCPAGRRLRHLFVCPRGEPCCLARACDPCASGEKATLVTPISCPRRQAASAPVRASKTRTVLSSDAIAILEPSGEKATLLNFPSCPRTQAGSAPVGVSQRRTVLSSPRLRFVLRRVRRPRSLPSPHVHSGARSRRWFERPRAESCRSPSRLRFGCRRVNATLVTQS